MTNDRARFVLRPSSFVKQLGRNFRRAVLECLNLLVRLRLDEKRQRLIARFIDTYLRLNAVEEQRFWAELEARTPMEKEAVMEVLTSWEERGLKRGLQQGREEGREEGRQQEAVAFVMRLLTRRFGSLPADRTEQIRSLSTAQLEELGEALLDFADQAQLAAWLQRNI